MIAVVIIISVCLLLGRDYWARANASQSQPVKKDASVNPLPFLTVVGIAWALIAAWQLPDIFAGHSLALFPQIVFIVASSCAMQCFYQKVNTQVSRRQTYGAVCSRLFRFTLLGIVATLIAVSVVNYSLSQEIYRAAIRGDDSGIRRLRLWGACVKPGVQGTATLRNLTIRAIRTGNVVTVHRLLEAGLDPNLARVGNGDCGDYYIDLAQDHSFLEEARLYQHPEIEALLKQYGAGSH